MKIIDRVKLDVHRQMIDEDVTNLCIDRCISRPQAYADLLAGLGHHLRLVFAAKDKVVGAVIDIEVLARVDASRHGPLLQPLPTRLTDAAVDQLKNTLCVGSFPEDVAAALLLQAIDPSVDLYLPAQAELHESAQSEWQRVGSGGFISSDFVFDRDPDQMSLFETESEFRKRNYAQRNIRSFGRMAESVNSFGEFAIDQEDSVSVFLIDCISRTFDKRRPNVNRKMRDRKRNIESHLLSAKKFIY